jgi:hypothetical protein
VNSPSTPRVCFHTFEFTSTQFLGVTQRVTIHSQKPQAKIRSRGGNSLDIRIEQMLLRLFQHIICTLQNDGLPALI